MTLTETAQTCLTADGLELAAWHASPGSGSGEVLGRVWLLHGYAEHSGRYRHVAEALVSAGFEVWRLDWRGHGESQGPRGYCSRFSDYALDLDALNAESPIDALPRFIVAHSMGALAAVRWLQGRNVSDLRVKGFVLSSPFFALKLAVPAWKKGLAGLLSGALPKLALANELKAADLMRDGAMQAAWAADEKILHKVPTRWFTEALQAQEALMNEAARVNLPLIVHHGEDDPVANPAASKTFVDAVSSGDKAWRGWPGLRHEIFNEPERAEVFAEIVTWLKTHCA